MTTPKEQRLGIIKNIRAELFQVLDGMDYCLDWRPEPDSWSAREVITHMLNTPPPGVPSILRDMLAGEIEEYDLWADQKYLTPEAQGWDMTQVRAQFGNYFEMLEETLGATAEDDLAGASVMVHQRNRRWDEPRTAQWLVERLFAGHWREHLVQLQELRDALGI